MAIIFEKPEDLWGLLYAAGVSPAAVMPALQAVTQVPDVQPCAEKDDDMPDEQAAIEEPQQAEPEDRPFELPPRKPGSGSPSNRWKEQAALFRERWYEELGKWLDWLREATGGVLVADAEANASANHRRQLPSVLRARINYLTGLTIPLWTRSHDSIAQWTGKRRSEVAKHTREVRRLYEWAVKTGLGETLLGLSNRRTT